MKAKKEILFRAISLCRGEHWLYGMPLHHARNPHTEKWGIYDPETGIETDIDPVTLGQYVGKKDAEGTRIFEGDILIVYGRPAYVAYVDELAVYRLIRPSGFQYAISDLENDAVVMGNIYDNPEILTNKL